MHKMQRTTINVPKGTWQRAKLKALREDLTLSEVVRRLLSGWISGEVEIGVEDKSRDRLITLARSSRRMWADREPETYLADSRAGLETKDEELGNARLDV